MCSLGANSGDVVVWDTPPPITVTPSSLTFLYPMGSATESVPGQLLTVQSGGVPFPLSIVGGLPLVYPSTTSALTPASVSVSIRELPDYSSPGEYHSSFQITTPGTTISVPVTVLVTPIVPPVIGSVVNAASQIQGAVAPGEIVTIYGFAVGPPNALGFTLDSSGAVATNYNGTQVLFDGKPAPLLYSSPSRTTLVVPYEVADRQSTNIEVAYNGARPAAWGMPIAPSAPAIFTLDGSGMGQAAALNQDNSSNGPSNPAPRGTVIQVWATGAGQTSPPGATGSLIGTSVKIPVLPLRVTIDGVEAPVQFVGSAPDSVDGLLQLNVVLPQTVTPGLAVPISMTAGGAPVSG